MAQIILDFGSGNTHKNNWDYCKRMIDELRAVDTGEHEVIIKHQLFQKAGDNIPLDIGIFHRAYWYAERLGYKTTSSVFDKSSLNVLLELDVPFVKIANRPDLHWLIGEIPRRVSVYVSIGKYNLAECPINPYYLTDAGNKEKILCCVSDYPADIDQYFAIFPARVLHYGISDHTINFDLWNEIKPEIIEWHYKLPDSTGLDAGPFARTPKQLSEVL